MLLLIIFNINICVCMFARVLDIKSFFLPVDIHTSTTTVRADSSILLIEI